ncbi:MAG: hypothetical protein RIS35_3599 [Pseudomonadota bacterium]|jgi:mono/diheme cytochrome c family protein
MSRISGRKRGALVAAAAVVALLAIAAALWATSSGVVGTAVGPSTADTVDPVERGRYLALAANCAGCHTARGEAPYAGGRGIETPFGTVYASNLTSDPETGLGRWNKDDFWRAMREGRSRDGRLLYPAFPYPNFSGIAREDADALFAYLSSLPPIRRENRPHALRFPYDRQVALAAWRALFFRPLDTEPVPDRGEDWNRGAYLVRVLGHCEACHAERNLLGATERTAGLSGGRIPAQGWDAPPLAPHELPGVPEWTRQDFVDLLRTGLARQGSAMGPMSEVVAMSTRHLTGPDLQAIAVYLSSLPRTSISASKRDMPAGAVDTVTGRRLYGRHCADCHGDSGEGVAGAYPALAGNQTLNLPSPDNAIRAVLGGGFLPSSAQYPKPHGMPPFSPFLSDEEIAAVLTYTRTAWGNDAPPIQARSVSAHRGRTNR